MKVSARKNGIKYLGVAFYTFICIIGSKHVCLGQANIKDCAAVLPILDSVPRMWVDYKQGIGYEANFVNLQNVQLSSYLRNHHQGTQDTKSVFFPIASFRKMLEYFESLGNYSWLHVYIASYGGSGTGPVPAGYENKLTLLFAPSPDNQYDQTFYSITPSGNFDPKSDSCVIKNSSWIDNYSIKMNTALINNLVDTPDNYDRSGHFSDTRRIEYDRNDICQLFTEFNYQKQNNNIDVTGIEALFSSFPNTGRPKDLLFKNRIFVLFEFTQNINGKNIVFYIDEQTGFDKRKKPIQTYPITAMKVYMTSVDNGHLCPPNCP
jgi:hypothetical protein